MLNCIDEIFKTSCFIHYAVFSSKLFGSVDRPSLGRPMLHSCVFILLHNNKAGEYCLRPVCCPSGVWGLTFLLWAPEPRGAEVGNKLSSSKMCNMLHSYMFRTLCALYAPQTSNMEGFRLLYMLMSMQPLSHTWLAQPNQAYMCVCLDTLPHS